MYRFDRIGIMLAMVVCCPCPLYWLIARGSPRPSVTPNWSTIEQLTVNESIHHVCHIAAHFCVHFYWIVRVLIAAPLPYNFAYIFFCKFFGFWSLKVCQNAAQLPQSDWNKNTKYKVTKTSKAVSQKWWRCLEAFCFGGQWVAKSQSQWVKVARNGMRIEVTSVIQN